MRCGSREGTSSSKSTLPTSAPPDSPVRATWKAPRRAPASTPRTILGLLPLVESATKTSPGETSDSICRAKTCSKPLSLLAAVSTDGLVVSASAARPGRSARSRTTSSAAMCCASAALPPLPKNTSFPPSRSAAAAFTANSSIRVSKSSGKLCFTRQLSWSCARISSRCAPMAGSAEDDFVALAGDASGGVAGINHQLRSFDDRGVVVAAVVSGNHHAVVAGQHLGRQLDRAHPRVVVVAHLVQLREVGIVVLHLGAALAQQLHDLQRGRFPQVVHVLLVGHAQHQDA